MKKPYLFSAILAGVFLLIGVQSATSNASAKTADPVFCSKYLKYYTIPEFYQYLSENSRSLDAFGTVGKFDGDFSDTLFVFPVEASAYREDWSDWDLYKKMEIRSKYGSVPPLHINMRLLKTPDDPYDPVGFYVPGSGRWGSDISVSKAKFCFEKGGEPVDAICVDLHPEGSTIGIDYIYYFKGGKWENADPWETYYRPYETCKEIWPEWWARHGDDMTASSVWYADGEGVIESTVTLFPLGNPEFGKGDKEIEGDYVLRGPDLKTRDIISGNPVRIYPYPNPVNPQYKLLAIEFESTPGIPDRHVELYTIGFDCCDLYFINGVPYVADYFWNKAGEGFYGNGSLNIEWDMEVLKNVQRF